VESDTNAPGKVSKHVDADGSVLHVILLPYADRSGTAFTKQEDARAVDGKSNALVLSFGDATSNIKTPGDADLFLSMICVLKADDYGN